MPLEPVEPRRLYRQIAMQLRRLIDEAEFPADSRLLPDGELAAKLDVSPPTVREVCAAFEVAGRGGMRVGSGICVPTQRTALRAPLEQRLGACVAALALHTEDAAMQEAAQQQPPAIRNAIAAREPWRARAAMNADRERSGAPRRNAVGSWNPNTDPNKAAMCQ